MKEMAVKIKLLSPAVISDSGVSGVLSSSQDSISGTVVRGIFANEYIRRKQLGSKAHEDEAFQELFYGGLRFLPATLWDEASGNSAVKIPLCLQKSKEKAQKIRPAAIFPLRDGAKRTGPASAQKARRVSARPVRRPAPGAPAARRSSPRPRRRARA